MTTVQRFSGRRKAREIAAARAKWPSEIKRMMRAVDKVRAGHKGRLSAKREGDMCVVRDSASGKILSRSLWDEVDEAEHRLIEAQARLAVLKAKTLLQNVSRK